MEQSPLLMSDTAADMPYWLGIRKAARHRLLLNDKGEHYSREACPWRRLNPADHVGAVYISRSVPTQRVPDNNLRPNRSRRSLSRGTNAVPSVFTSHTSLQRAYVNSQKRYESLQRLFANKERSLASEQKPFAS